jgi:hypothetical protein
MKKFTQQFKIAKKKVGVLYYDTIRNLYFFSPVKDQYYTNEVIKDFRKD